MQCGLIAPLKSHCSACGCFVVHAPRLRMLNLGDGGDQNLSTASTWKVLVYDKFLSGHGADGEDGNSFRQQTVYII